MGHVAPPDDEDGYPGNPRRFDPNDDLLRVIVPDDPRDLEADIAAYHRELELARKRDRREQGLFRFVPKWARGALPSPVFTALLLLVATSVLLLSVFAPVVPEQRGGLPISSLAAREPALEGKVGGLLPDVELVSNSGRIQTHTVRPAVFVLVPPRCDCATMIQQIVGQANEVPPAPYVLFVSAGTDQTAAQLATVKVAGGQPPLAFQDLDGVFNKTFQASATAPTLLFVTGDGKLSSKQVFHDGKRIESDLTPLHFPV